MVENLDENLHRIVKSYSIATIVIQLIFCLTLQFFQLTKVKGAIRIYLIFDLFSVLAINTSFLGLVKEYGHSKERFSLDRGDLSNVTLLDFEIESWALNGFYSDLSQFFVDLRKCCMALIVNDSYMLVSRPFDFKEYMETKNIIRRCLFMMGYFIAFHCLHELKIIVNLIFFFNHSLSIRAFFWRIADSKIDFAKISFMFLFNFALVYKTSFQCSKMKKSIKEIVHNGFANHNGKLCYSLYKMVIILISVITSSTLIDVTISIVHMIKSEQNSEMYLFVVKATFDTFVSILVMIVFQLSFPSLRPARPAQPNPSN